MTPAAARWVSGLALTAALTTPSGALAGGKAGLRLGYDSNVDRSVDDPRGQGYAALSVGAGRDTPGEDRLEWTGGVTGEATVYTGLEDLNSAALGGEVGLLWIPRARWAVSVIPFARGKVVRDADQSAVDFGVRAGLRQQWAASWYLAESYAYTDSRAREDVYSYREHALGAALGLEWSPRLRGEIGYQFSRGDSFRAVEGARDPALRRQVPPARNGPGAGGGSGGKGPGTYPSGAFGEDLVSETVDRHAAGLTLELDGPRSISWSAGYWYSAARGDSGTAVRHEVFVGGSLAL